MALELQDYAKSPITLTNKLLTEADGIISDTLAIVGATPLRNAFAISRTNYDANVPQSVKDDTSILIAIDETA